VVKQDSRTEFDREGCPGFMRALHKRPVPTPLVDDAVNAVVQQTLARGELEIRSRRIGEMVMKELYKLDDVAYIRFASVYKSFQDVDDFQDAIKEVRKPPGKNK
jgi:transcriptional repressor NrdR